MQAGTQAPPFLPKATGSDLKCRKRQKPLPSVECQACFPLCSPACLTIKRKHCLSLTLSSYNFGRSWKGMSPFREGAERSPTSSHEGSVMLEHVPSARTLMFLCNKTAPLVPNLISTTCPSSHVSMFWRILSTIAHLWIQPQMKCLAYAALPFLLPAADKMNRFFADQAACLALF